MDPFVGKFPVDFLDEDWGGLVLKSKSGNVVDELQKAICKHAWGKLLFNHSEIY